MTIILHHKRHPELVNDQHLWSGMLELQGTEGQRVTAVTFVDLLYRKVLGMVSSMLQEYPDDPVVFLRTDRSGLQPIQLGEATRVLLRDDPVQAIRSMDVQGAPSVQGDEQPVVLPPGPVLRAGFDTLADAFGERVFLRMQKGRIEDPLTGQWRQLAFGPKIGWRIRGKNNDSASWMPIQLEDVPALYVSGDAEEGELAERMQSWSASLAACRWASLAVEDLLQVRAQRFFLPRRWNQEQWIDREALQRRLDRYLKERSES